jgi:hypothetical protein
MSARKLVGRFSPATHINTMHSHHDTHKHSPQVSISPCQRGPGSGRTQAVTRDRPAWTIIAVGFAALSLAWAVLLFCGSYADAGTWTLASCTQPNGQPAPTEGWTTGALGGVGAYSGDVDSCPQGGSLTAMTSSEAPQQAYQGPEWVFTAPAGSTIAGGTLTAALTAPHGQAWLATPASSYDSANILANCQYNLQCGTSGTYGGVFPITHTGGTSIYAIAVCVGPYEGATTCPADGGLDAAVYVSAAEIEFANDSSPQGSGFTGPLLNPNARGTQDLAFAASDPDGPGVYSVTVQADGQTLYAGTPDGNDGQCTPVGTNAGTLVFDAIQPCKQSESVDLPIDTTLLTDGPHTLKVTVEDAAENSSVVYDTTITTNNAPADTWPPTVLTPSQLAVQTLLSAQPGGWSAPAGAGAITYTYQWQDCNTQGENCQTIPGAQSTSYTPAPSDVGHTLRVLVDAADNDGTATAASAASAVVLSASGSLGATPGPGIGPTTATPGPGSTADIANGTNASETASFHLGVARSLLRHFGQRAFKLTGRLTDLQDDPIANATLEVLQQTQGANTTTLIGTARTNTTGAFALTIPPGPSRRIVVAYRAFSADAGYAATVSVVETVTAGVQLQVTPRLTTPTGPIELSGTVYGPIPPQGAIVELLVHYRGSWEPFRKARTNSHGQFRAVYRFEGSIGSFPFQAEVPDGQAAFPFATGYSQEIAVRSR